MTPAGPDMKMKMKEDFLHFVVLRLAACELQTTTLHKLDVSHCEDPAVKECLTQRVVKLRCRVMSDGVASHRLMVCRNSQGSLETRRVAKCG
jgi:hypothetical protein